MQVRVTGGTCMSLLEGCSTNPSGRNYCSSLLHLSKKMRAECAFQFPRTNAPRAVTLAMESKHSKEMPG